MKDAAKQGWNVFFWAIDQRFPVWLKDVLYVAIFVSQFLCGLATVTSASRMIFAFARDDGLPGLERPEEGQPCTPHARCGDLDGRDPRRSVRLGRLARHHRRGFGLLDRRVLHGHLPVLLLRDPDRARTAGLRQDLDEDGTVESRRAPVQARRGSVDPVGDPDLLHRRSAAERLGAVDHRRLRHSDRRSSGWRSSSAASRARRSAT